MNQICKTLASLWNWNFSLTSKSLIIKFRKWFFSYFYIVDFLQHRLIIDIFMNWSKVKIILSCKFPPICIVSKIYLWWHLGQSYKVSHPKYWNSVFHEFPKKHDYRSMWEDQNQSTCILTSWMWPHIFSFVIVFKIPLEIYHRGLSNSSSYVPGCSFHLGYKWVSANVSMTCSKNEWKFYNIKPFTLVYNTA
jgi:hypothetical protein